jgi:hypothetical protein
VRTHQKRLTSLGGLFGLLMMLVSPAAANFIQPPKATVTCTGYTIALKACHLSKGTNYTIDYDIELTPSSGSPSEISHSVNFTAKKTTNGTSSCPNNTFSDTVSGSPSPPFPLAPGDYSLSGTATLEGLNTTEINFSPSSLTCDAPPVCSAGVSISGSMEGNLPVNPGDTIKAGFDFTVPGSHAADTVTFSNVSVTLPVQCPNGSTDTLTIPIPNQTITDPANDGGDWFPSGDQNSPLVYQGSITAPSNLCGGEQGHAPQGATFTASLAASTNDSVHVRFHYSDNTSGSWSGTNSYCQ